jgi:hypothetical protein
MAEQQLMHYLFSFYSNDTIDNELMNSAYTIPHSGTDGLESASNTPTERVELLFNSDVNKERRNVNNVRRMMEKQPLQVKYSMIEMMMKKRNLQRKIARNRDG